MDGCFERRHRSIASKFSHHRSYDLTHTHTVSVSLSLSLTLLLEDSRERNTPDRFIVNRGWLWLVQVRRHFEFSSPGNAICNPHNPCFHTVPCLCVRRGFALVPARRWYAHTSRSPRLPIAVSKRSCTSFRATITGVTLLRAVHYTTIITTTAT